MRNKKQLEGCGVSEKCRPETTDEVVHSQSLRPPHFVLLFWHSWNDLIPNSQARATNSPKHNSKPKSQNPNPKSKASKSQINIRNKNPIHNPESKSDPEPESTWKTQLNHIQSQNKNPHKNKSPTWNSSNQNNIGKHSNTEAHIPNLSSKYKSKPESKSQIEIQDQVKTIIAWKQ